MPPKKELRRLEIQESDTDSDYNPKTIATKRKKQAMGGIESPSASDTDSGRRKRKQKQIDVEAIDDPIDTGKKQKFDENLTDSEVICQMHGLTNVDVEIPDEYLSDLSYKKFNKLVRPLIQEANPHVSGLRVTSLLSAKWREFKELYGMDTLEQPDLERVKNLAVPSPSASESDVKDSAPASPDSLTINESGEGSDEDEYEDDESSNDLKLKMIRRGNKIFRAGDRKTSRQSKKTARQGIVNLDDINLDDVTRAEEQDESSQDVLRKKPGPKKRTGPRIKNTKDKKEKEKEKIKIAATRGRGGKRGPYGKRAVKVEMLRKFQVTVNNDAASMDGSTSSRVVVESSDMKMTTDEANLIEKEVISPENSIPDHLQPSTPDNTESLYKKQQLWNSQLRAENLELERNLIMSQQETMNLNKQYMELKIENQMLKNNEMKQRMYNIPTTQAFPTLQNKAVTVDTSILSKSVETNVFSVLETQM